MPSRLLPSSSTLSRLVRHVLRTERARWTGELNVIFVDDPEIRRLNRRFLREHGTTDVIAFRYDRPPHAPASETSADIYVCVSEAARNADRFQVPVTEEIVRLAVHGTLHLLGYEDHKPKDRKQMWARQENAVRRWRERP